MTDARVPKDAPWLSSGSAAHVLDLLNRDGEEARVIGGAVRNALLNVPVSDIDIATTALPEEVARRAKAAGIKSVPTGIEHGTVTLVVDSHPFEVTTLREDTETFGRKAKVAFGRDWASDAQRRDFTINGLSAGLDGVVHDYVGGLADIAVRRVRFIGDPHKRIAEDYLRILRFFRIHAAFGAGEPNREGYLACIAGRAGLAGLGGACAHGNAEADGRARRRCRHRGDGGWRIAADDFRRGRLYRAVYVDDRGGAAAWARSRPGPPSRRARGRRHRGCQAHWRPASPDQCRDQNAGLDGPSLVAARRHGRSERRGAGFTARRGALTATGCCWPGRGAGGNTDPAPWQELATLPERWHAPKFPLKAADFVARGIAEGPALGQVLAQAEDAWLAAEFPLDRAALQVIADQIVTPVQRDVRP